MSVVQRWVLGRVVRYVRSGPGQGLVARGRAAVATLANRDRTRLAAARLRQRVGTPANQVRAAEWERRLRSGGAAGR